MLSSIYFPALVLEIGTLEKYLVIKYASLFNIFPVKHYLPICHWEKANKCIRKITNTVHNNYSVNITKYNNTINKEITNKLKTELTILNIDDIPTKKVFALP